jgi:hypothetical protein
MILEPDEALGFTNRPNIGELFGQGDLRRGRQYLENNSVAIRQPDRALDLEQRRRRKVGGSGRSPPTGGLIVSPWSRG